MTLTRPNSLSEPICKPVDIGESKLDAELPNGELLYAGDPWGRAKPSDESPPVQAGDAVGVL